MSLNRSSFGLFRMTTPFSYTLRQSKCIENLIKPEHEYITAKPEHEYITVKNILKIMLAFIQIQS